MSRTWSALTLLLTMLLVGSPVSAEVRSETIDYRQGDTDLQGILFWDDSFGGRRPGILVVHEWWGLNDYIKNRARMLAQLGYVAFAADMYGGGKTTEHGETAKEWMEQITANQAQWQARALAGLEQLRSHRLVDSGELAAIGYCFGGTTVLQLAYAGSDVNGVVSFHGSLPIPAPQHYDRISARILATVGSEDSFIPPEQRIQFGQALDEADADWHLVVHGGARHAFTNPGAGAFGIENLQYDEAADRRSWQHMQLFFDELFARQE